ncbi:ABC transporter ATP-binding protein [Streptomyces sp. NPDC048257]|uniref:ABC transporter ATP-binding protein n=1 Tax=Streptomyces sp. NPDC048257 TaxID=3365526 RepID=UPI00371E4488
MLDGISLSLEAGEIVGLLGLNGAGKTTLMRLMTGLALPSSGDIHLFGEPLPMRPAQLARIGAALDAPSFPRWLTGRAVLRMLLESAGRPDGGRTGAVLDRVGLAHAADKRVGTYSQGMRQRLAIAAALLKRPDLLILDEPTNGLDPEGLRMVRRVIAEESARGATVLVSSHQLDEIQRICHRVIMVADGRVAAAGTLEQLGYDPDSGPDAFENWFFGLVGQRGGGSR